MSDSVRPHGWWPTRLPRPWNSPGKNTGVGCHCLLQCMKVKSESEVAQLCLTLRDPMDCSLPGSSVHGISQARGGSGSPLPSPLHMRTLQIEGLCSVFPRETHSLRFFPHVSLRLGGHLTKPTVLSVYLQKLAALARHCGPTVA